MKFFILFILVLGSTAIDYAQLPGKGRVNLLPLKNQVQEWVDSGYYTGASVIIYHNNELLYQHRFGNHTPETVVYIASAGKWLAAATIAAVVDKGVLSWDDPVKKWLPAFTGSKGEATLRQLLSHTAGYPDYQPKGTHRDDYQTLEEAVQHIVSLPADTLPGRVFHYGGLAMQVAGRMAELATGKDWETLFQQLIAQPLHMRQTHFTPVDSTPGHNPMVGGGARSGLQDYANFLSMLYNKGMYKGKRVLTAAAVQELQADQIKNATIPTDPHNNFVKAVRGGVHKGIYGLGEWREQLNAQGQAVLVSSPSWAGAYPWIDKEYGVYGFILARVADARNGFDPFHSSPELPVLVRKALQNAGYR